MTDGQDTGTYDIVRYTLTPCSGTNFIKPSLCYYFKFENISCRSQIESKKLNVFCGFELSVISLLLLFLQNPRR